MKQNHFKDDILFHLSRVGNIAQFMSFSPTLKLRHFKIFASRPKQNIRENLLQAIKQSSEKRVNVRSFHPEQPKGHPFVYGLKTVDDVYDVLKSRADEGLYTIVNETIDTNDGGVSGVSLGTIVEFTPNDTPKGVDKPGVCGLPRGLAKSVLKTVYGFDADIPSPKNMRVEFSIHPKRRGIRNSHTVLWELEKFAQPYTESRIAWPNNFSKHVGDKAFGLLIAHNLGFNVPKTLVISRRVKPFEFGKETGLIETWIRTAPFERTPGKFSTFFGWSDPFKLLAEEDPLHDKISSVISQQAVDALYSGSLITSAKNKPIIEGVKGRGDEFMVGTKMKSTVPSVVRNKVRAEFAKLLKILGPIEMEWVYDGRKLWIVQLHILKEKIGTGNVIFVGKPSHYEDFDVNHGLEKLRNKIETLKNKNIGIRLIGNVGITSHFGDVLRKAKIPSLIVRNAM